MQQHETTAADAVLPQSPAQPTRGKKPWPHPVSMDEQQIVLQLQQLLQQAMSGQIQGLLVAVHYGGQEFGYGGVGSFCKQPNLAMAPVQHFTDRFLSPFRTKKG